MTEEKYNVSNMALKAYERQFSMQRCMVNKLSAFKTGIANAATLRRITTQVDPSSPKIKVAPLTKHMNSLPDPTVKKMKKQGSVKSFRGKIIREDTIDDESEELKEPPAPTIEFIELGNATKDDMLASYIGE